MPRFYFSLRKDGNLTVDAEGTELLDLEAAKREANMGLRELFANAIKAADQDESIPDTIVVFDERGEERYALSLDEILPKRLRRKAPQRHIPP
jgi:hypothetical protein